MGFLTTFTVRNDFLDSISNNPKEFTEKIVSFCHRDRCDGDKYYGSDVIPQFTRHADDHTVYVHMGNTVVEMNPYCTETKALMKSHPEFFLQMLKFMKAEVKELDRRYKEVKVEKEGKNGR